MVIPVNCDGVLERETGIEPATNGLGSRYSTIELLPLDTEDYTASVVATRRLLNCSGARSGLIQRRCLQRTKEGAEKPPLSFVTLAIYLSAEMVPAAFFLSIKRGT